MPLMLVALSLLAAHPAAKRVDTTAPSARAERPLLATADSIVIHKATRRLRVYVGDRRIREMRIALGRNPVGDKTRRGDGRTPEGRFFVSARNPESRYHLGLRLSYPTPEHVARARAQGVSPGGDIMIHGLPPRWAHVGAAHINTDWTEGCVAVSNAEIEALWTMVPVGTPVIITP